MLKIELTSGKMLDAETVEMNSHTVELLDRNGDVLNRVGHPLVESIEAL